MNRGVEREKGTSVCLIRDEKICPEREVRNEHEKGGSFWERDWDGDSV